MESKEKRSTEVTFPILQEDELPPITDGMKAIATEILGPYAEKYDPNSIEAYFKNGQPAFSIGFIYVEDYPGEPIWENAWNGFVERLKDLVYINDRRKGSS